MAPDDVDALLEDCLLERPATAWAARVEAACAEHPGLAAELRRRFEKLASLGLLAAPFDDPLPDRLGHYRLLRRLGGGGMGVVYEAHDERLQRRVALKVIRNAELYFAGARERFAREMLAASRLDHPNVCPIYDAGEIDGVPYLTMRYIEGDSLATRLDARRRALESPISPPGGDSARFEAVVMTEKLARALHAAHDAGLVHRDVKPGNVIVDRTGEPMLLDFGLARAVEPSAPGLTRTGERLGTPAYMAPEQVTGRRAADRRTDVYSLGATLYECLTLHHPHESSSPEELYHKIVAEPPPDPRRFAPGLDGELCVVVGKALQKRPEDRFATAAEFADELRRICQHEPIRSRRPSAWLRVLRWSQRNPTAAGVLTATFIGLTTSLALLYWSVHAERRVRQASTEYRALALLQAAGDCEDLDPQRALRYAREALRLDDDERIVARTQEILFDLRAHAVVSPDPASYAAFSPDSNFVVTTRPGAQARLFRRAHSNWREVELPDPDWRTGNATLPAVAFSADANELLLTGHGSTSRRYSLRSTPPRALEPPPRTGRPRFHPDPGDPRLLLVQVAEAITSVWARDGDAIHHLADLPHAEPRGCFWYDAGFLPNGCIVAGGKLWDTDYRELSVLPSPAAESINAVLVGTDHFVFTSSENHLTACDLDGRLLAHADLPFRHDHDFIDVDLDRGGTRLLVARAGQLSVLDAHSLIEVEQWTAAAVSRVREGWHARFAPDGRRIAASDGYGRIKLWSVQGTQLDEFAAHGMVARLEWTPDGRGLLAVSGPSVRVWHLSMHRGVPAYSGLGDADAAVSANGDTVVFTASHAGTVWVCDARGTPRMDPIAIDFGTPHLRFIADDRVVIGSQRRSRFSVLDLAGGAARVHELQAPRPLGNCPPLLLADGTWLLPSRRRIFRWRPNADPEQVAVGPTLHLAAAPDGSAVAFGGFSQSLGAQLWSTERGVLRNRWSAPVALTVRFVAFTRDGRHLLAAGNDGTARLWPLQQTEESAEDVFAGHQAPLVCACLSVDETRIATAANDGTIRIWDRATRRATLRLRHSGVRRIAFTSSGQLVSAGSDGTVRWWWLDVAPLRSALRGLDIEPLTDEERLPVRHLLDG